jgi:leader peptidase (prepilin peptidase)/N-methyltransferase
MTGDGAYAVYFASVMGLLIGSFLNVVIARAPAGESVIRPPSHCPVCLTELRARDNVPLLSWLLLRGKCRTCGTSIGAIYPAVEGGTALLFALVAVRVGAHADLPAYLLATAAFVALSVIDLQARRLPDRVVFPAFLLTFLALAGAAAVDDRFDDLGRAGIGAAVGFGALLTIHLVRPDGMGFGDVKLAALCGLLLGWEGLATVIVGLYAGFVLGAVVGLGIIAAGRGGRQSAIPFGPFMAAGTLVTVLFLGPVTDRVADLF